MVTTQLFDKGAKQLNEIVIVQLFEIGAVHLYEMVATQLFDKGTKQLYEIVIVQLFEIGAVHLYEMVATQCLTRELSNCMRL